MNSTGRTELFWKRPDLVERFNLTCRLGDVNAVRAERRGWLERSCWDEAAARWSCLPEPDQLGAVEAIHGGPAVGVKTTSPIDPCVSERLRQFARSVHPWRKGPFRLGDFEIDAEWRSDLKYQRVASALGDLTGRRILDVGAGNGYYMMRMAEGKPCFVYGIDPSAAFLFQFEFIQRYLRDDRLQLDLLGVEHLELFAPTFDIAVCMGIVYHQRHPMQVVMALRDVLRAGGRCLLESQTVPGEESVALFPAGRYAKARNVYFLPTAACLENWMRRAGFRDVRRVSHTPVTAQEQRRTEWMTFESLGDFLDPADPGRTVEGHPAPWRTAVVGFKPG